MKNVLLSLILAFLLFGCSSKYENMKTVKSVDIERYKGTWYEISRLDHSFEKGCKNVTATYEIKEENKIKVINRCTMIKDNKIKEATGIAYAVDNSNAKLKVSFFRPFYGDYWIIYLNENYDYVLVGHPSREYLWILSRTKTINEETKIKLMQKAKEEGFDTNKFIWTIQD